MTDRFANDVETWESNGRNLSQRIWLNRVALRQHIDTMIAEAVRTGQTAEQVADHLIRYVRPSYARTGLPGDGTARYAANRLAGNEMRRGHSLAAQQVAMTDPAGGYLRYTVSPGHADPDECVIAGTMISTPSGLVPIQDVREGDLVWTHRCRGQRVTRTFRRRLHRQSIVQIRAQGGRSQDHLVVMTPNHPVLTDRGWTPAGDLQMGSRCYAGSEVLGGCQHRPEYDAPGRGRLDSLENVPIGSLQRTFGQLCDVTAPWMIHIWHKLHRGSHEPTLQRTCAYGMSVVYCHLSNWDCFRLSVLRTISTAFQQALSTFRGFGSRSWGYLILPGTACIPANSTFSCHEQRMMPHTPDRVEAWRHVGPDSTHWNNSVGRSRFEGVETQRHMLDRFSQPVCCDLSTAIGTMHYRTADPRSATENARSNAVQVGLHSGRNALWERAFSYINYIMHRRNLEVLTVVSIDRNDAFSGDVFNLEVECDNSYLANGIVVHNCDGYAHHSEGFGRGVYPAKSCPMPPIHVACRCSVDSVQPQGRDVAEDMDAFVEQLRVEYDLADPPDLSPADLAIFRQQTAQVREDVQIMFRGWFEQTGLVSREQLVATDATVRQWVEQVKQEKRRRRR